MAKKKKKKDKKHPFRNAAPRAPRADKVDTTEHTPLKQLAYTAGGAVGVAFLGPFLAREGWAPKTIATALTATGAGLAWKAGEPVWRNVGSGVMSAAGGQLALMMLDEHKPTTLVVTRAPTPPVATAPAKKPTNADALPPGALEAALARAQTRLALSEQELAA
ncbi:MAG TPA: hypothetical protein VH143_25305 [Kofleriaceae bacterium]|jgi:hypothetical protein|nr:hypothetical protein [Kofleriaceae bacterium]